MNKKVRWITRTGIMLAILVVLQALTKPLGQLVTGSCVNGVLALTALFAGMYSGIAVALLSPVLAFLLGIAPQILTVPAIMAGNTVYVVALYLIAGKAGENRVRQLAGWALAALAKFATLYALVVWLLCGALGQTLVASGAMKPMMLTVLPTTFGASQLLTALIGGSLALVIAPYLRTALNK